MKALSILLLVGLTLSAPLTPLTNLPPEYDDMLFNRLQGHKVTQSLIPTAQISKEYSRMATIEEVSAELNEKFSWIPKESVVHIHKSFSTLEAGFIANHLIQAAKNEEGKTTSALIQVVVVKEKIRMICASLVHKAYQPAAMHLLYISKFGLGLSKPEVLIGTLSPAIQKLHDVITIDTLFSCLQKFRGSQKGDYLATGALGQTTFTGVLDAIKAVASAWQSVASAFKTVNRETFKYVIKGQGFSQFQQSSIFLRSMGIDLRRWEQFKPLYMTSTGLDSPQAARESAEVFLTLAEFMPDNVWQFNDHTFDKNGLGSTSTMVAFTKADLDVQKAHILTVVTSGSYQLAPDVYVYEKYKSVAGGIYQNTKEVRKNVPRNLSLEDIKGINAMAMLNAINVMTTYFNIDFKLPSNDPLKLV